MPMVNEPGTGTTPPKPVEMLHGHDIPLARDSLKRALVAMARDGSEASAVARERYVKLRIEEALRWMEPKVVNKTPGRSSVPITAAHEAKLEALFKAGAFNRLTYAEIALDVFGVPCHLGWLASKFSGRQA